MTHLTKALARARQGRGQVILLAGSGGIGKTRLAQELGAQAEQEGVAVLWGRCLEEPGAPPYWPWRQLIRGYLRSSDTDVAQTLGAGLADIARTHGAFLVEINPETTPVSDAVDVSIRGAAEIVLDAFDRWPLERPTVA